MAYNKSGNHRSESESDDHESQREDEFTHAKPGTSKSMKYLNPQGRKH